MAASAAAPQIMREKHSRPSSDVAAPGSSLPLAALAAPAPPPLPSRGGLFSVLRGPQAIESAAIAAEITFAENKKEEAETRDAATDKALAEIPQDEAAVLRSQLTLPDGVASFFRMYRYATRTDIALLVLATLIAVVNGALRPLTAVVNGAISNDFNAHVIGESSRQTLKHNVAHNSLFYVYIGVADLATGIGQTYLFVRLGERLASRYRKAYLRATIAQNVAYFDHLGGGEVTTRIVSDTSAIQDGISEKIGLIVSAFASFLSSVIISIVLSWRLGLILIAGVVYLVGGMAVAVSFAVEPSVRAVSVYASGATIVEEALTLIRTTVAMGIQDKLVAKLDVFLRRSKFWQNRVGFSHAFALAVAWSAWCWIAALTYWQGSRYIVSGHTNVGHVIAIFQSTIGGAFELIEILPLMQYVVKGIAAAENLGRALDRKPPINGLDVDSGRKLPEVRGELVFEHVRFRYPSRPDQLVLPDFSLKIEPGQTVALVGKSGSGKSTIVALLERFYLPLAGSITLDGVELTDLNVQWLRQQIGYVSQEPTLFAKSIFDNVADGLGSAVGLSDAEKYEKVVDACKQANAWGFIQNLQDGLDTQVGESGLLLSGGQKQRIAIARAIVGNPPILLLDEATSALDTVSEGIVQDALDRAARTRTTISIAHRLSTIRNADRIVVMADGHIAEQGTHDELVAAGGAYARLAAVQTVEQAVSRAEDAAAAAAEADRVDQSISKTAPNAVTAEKQANFSVTSVSAVGDALSVDEKATGVAEPHRGTLLNQGKPTLWKGLSLIFQLLGRNRFALVLAVSIAGLSGYAFPSISLLAAKAINALMVPASEYGQMRHDVNLYSGLLFMLGFVLAVMLYTSNTLFNLLSDDIVHASRQQLFQRYLRMDATFFDQDDHNAGALTSALATNSRAIEGVGGPTINNLTQSVVLLFSGIITAIAISWRIGLVATACIPLVVAAGYMRYRVLMILEERAEKVYRESGTVASRYVSGIRTVQALTREQAVLDSYNTRVDAQVARSLWPALGAAVGYGLSRALGHWVLALIFWYAGGRFANNTLTPFEFYVVLEAAIFGSDLAGSMFSFAPNFARAKQATRDMWRVFNTTPIIDVWSPAGAHVEAERLRGELEFRDVVFRYSTRPQVPVLTGLNLSIKQGQYVALVGPSGSGKSTTIGLIERFYDPWNGAVLLDGRDIRDYNLADMRKYMALVQQEPVLYAGTLRENVMYGWPGDEAEVTEDMLHAACRKANIHEFIMSLPEGYDTLSGPRGILLSGGQKQRIAVARALIRDPKVLLLDEATSALDTESEKVVQAALDAAAKGRTTIAVAHRLSTIQHADVIFVIDKGQVVERGTHAELVAQNGLYAELARLQNLDADA